jgi:hypothetical protein
VAGTVPVNSDIIPRISLVDRDIASAALVITRTTPDGPAQSFYGHTLGTPVSQIVSYISAENPVAMKKFTYDQPVFTGLVAGSQPVYFRPRDPGTYTLVVTARDGSNNEAVRSISVRAVLPGRRSPA